MVWRLRDGRRHGCIRSTCVLLGAFLPLLAPTAAAAAAVELVFTGTSGSGVTGGAAIEAQPGDTLTVDVRVEPSPETVAWISLSLAFDPAVLQAVSALECPAPPNPLAGLCYDGTLPTLSPVTAGPGSPNTTLEGDVNGDGAVGVPDAALLKEWTGVSVPPAAAALDLDGDGVVGGPHDWHLFGDSFGAPGSAGLLPGRVEVIEAGGSENTFLEDDFTLARVVFQVVGPGPSPIEVIYLPGIDGVVSGNPPYPVLADAADPTGVALTHGQVNPESIPALPSWALLAAALGIAAARGAARSLRPTT